VLVVASMDLTILWIGQFLTNTGIAVLLVMEQASFKHCHCSLQICSVPPYYNGNGNEDSTTCEVQ